MWSFYCIFLNVCLESITSYPVIEWFTPRLYPHFGTNQTLINCGFEQFSCISRVKTNSNLSPNENKSMDALIIYGSDLDIELKSLPFDNRIAKWALLHEESPLNNYRLAQKEVLNSMFDLTATFERNSSFPLTTQFIKSIDFLLNTNHMISVEEKNSLKVSKGLAPVIYVQSNCLVPSDRDRYVKELMKYIDIDSYGHCLNNKQFPKESNLYSSVNFDSKEFYEFIAQYKFMLTFENAICFDYISEKLWRSLNLGVIPIYRGTHTVIDWLPNNLSAIIIDEELEKSPSKLAQIINHLDLNDNDYNQYLIWKNQSIEKSNINLFKTLVERKWSVSEEDENDFIRGFECFVCEVLHGKHVIKKQELNGCPKPVPALGLTSSQLPSDDDWLYWEYEWNEAKHFETVLMNKNTKEEL